MCVWWTVYSKLLLNEKTWLEKPIFIGPYTTVISPVKPYNLIILDRLLVKQYVHFIQIADYRRITNRDYMTYITAHSFSLRIPSLFLSASLLSEKLCWHGHWAAGMAIGLLAWPQGRWHDHSAAGTSTGLPARPQGRWHVHRAVHILMILCKSRFQVRIDLWRHQLH